MNSPVFPIITAWMRGVAAGRGVETGEGRNAVVKLLCGRVSGLWWQVIRFMLAVRVVSLGALVEGGSMKDESADTVLVGMAIGWRQSQESLLAALEPRAHSFCM